ncbi:MAG: putative DNA binding domain-containing protein [Ekhidna sp.]|nr:putative DNA binding domain-containing protein [Ekhidna sp.]MBC6410658.1 putative DNA binding domain-containing protein [Ekhidna sp.]
MNEREQNILLSELRGLPAETEWVEFKTNNDQKLGEYLSALSNAACIHDKPYGYLVFGIEDKTHRIVGTDFDPNTKAKGNEDLIPWLARLLNPRIHFECYILNHFEGRVVMFRIKAVTNTPVTFQGLAFIRIGSYKKRLSEYPEKERLIWTKKPTVQFENEIARENLKVDDVLKLLDYPSYFDMMNLPLPSNKEGIIEKLKQERLISKENSVYSITNLGAILFAREIERFETLERKTIRVIIYDGKNKRKTIKEQIDKKGYAVGFEGLVDYIDDQLPTNEIIDSALRKEVKMYPKLAIRELVANAIIHQDFSERGTGPMIELFSDRIEITNPGKPLINTLRFVDHNPQSRNEKLAHFMRRLNICEERGSGIDKVLFECEFFQLPAPKFIEGENYTRIILYSHKTLRQMDKEDKISATYLHACLKVVSGENMTNQSLRERFGIEEKNYSIASRILSETIKSGLIKDYDPESSSKKHAKYVPFWA